MAGRWTGCLRGKAARLAVPAWRWQAKEAGVTAQVREDTCVRWLVQEMVRRGMERSVITFSSLISACEKAGQWEAAMRVFAEMQLEGIT